MYACMYVKCLVCYILYMCEVKVISSCICYKYFFNKFYVNKVFSVLIQCDASVSSNYQFTEFCGTDRVFSGDDRIY